jgi:hypothetical protein
MKIERPDIRPLEPLLGQLEQALIEAFVRGRGYDPLRLADLPEQERNALLKEASTYASGKLVEIEARSHFFDEIHAKEGPQRRG